MKINITFTCDLYLSMQRQRKKNAYRENITEYLVRYKYS